MFEEELNEIAEQLKVGGICVKIVYIELQRANAV
jgi:hypothetical protein